MFSLSIDPAAKAHLAETARWARFLAITGFVFLLLMVALGVYSSLTISRYEDMFNGSSGQRGLLQGVGAGMAVAYLILAVVGFFPLLFLLRFANGMHTALSGNNQVALDTAFQQLKVYFRYLGILLIISLVMMALSVLIGILGGTV